MERLNRTLGFEFEGFVNDYDNAESDSNLYNVGDVKTDGSLDCDESSGFEGIEFATNPSSKIQDHIQALSYLISEHDFQVTRRAGLHIHIDTRDFTHEDRVKLLRFGIGIEHMMFLINADYRRNSDYCERLHPNWRKVYKTTEPINFANNQQDDFGTFIYQQIRTLELPNGKNMRSIWNGRYQWLVAQTGYGTTEFRIFEATTDETLARNYGMIVYHIIETVKNSTINQLTYIINEIYKQKSLEAMLHVFYTSIGLDMDYAVGVRGKEVAEYITEKFVNKNNQVAVESSETVIGA